MSHSRAATIGPDRALAALSARIIVMLPDEYQESYETLEPKPMGSAPLRYRPDGQVAWDEVWGSFCDLAMAGGPPHKGLLLGPASAAEVAAARERHDTVVAEIARGIRMVTGLDAEASPVPGWVRVHCLDETAAGWLLRAIVMENVAVRAEGATLDLPAGPTFRLEKEVKNVITVIAKTHHYWQGHMWSTQKREIARLFETLAAESPLVAPAGDAALPEALAAQSTRQAAEIERRTGLPAGGPAYEAWLGLQTADVRAAVWMTRALVVSNVLARREGTVLFVPVNPASDPGGDRVAGAMAHVYGLAAAKGVLGPSSR